MTERDHLEKHVYAVVDAEHAIVWNKIKNATKEDRKMNLLQTTIQNGRWEDVKQLIKPYYEIRGELFVIDGVVMRMDRIVPPESFKEKNNKSRTQRRTSWNQMIRRKYWFPGMNTSIESAVQQCFSCQISTDAYRTEPAKMSRPPDRPWTEIETDFCGPLSNNKYALVVVDQYS